LKSAKKEIYGSRSQSHGGRSNGHNGDKLAESVQSVFDLALETQGPERTAELLEQLADRLRASQHELPRGFNTPTSIRFPWTNSRNIPVTGRPKSGSRA
jgi:hypothetical protein